MKQNVNGSCAEIFVQLAEVNILRVKARHWGRKFPLSRQEEAGILVSGLWALLRWAVEPPFDSGGVICPEENLGYKGYYRRGRRGEGWHRR